MTDKILKIAVVLLFAGLIVSICLTDGNKLELILCGLIALISATLFYKGKSKQ